MQPEVAATPTDAAPQPSLDERIASKFGLGEPEPQEQPPEETPSPVESPDGEEIEPEIVEDEPQAQAALEELEIKHNGEVRKVPKDEAVRLAQMGYDYEFKMGRVRENEQRLQSMAQALQAQHAMRAQALDALAEAKSFERQLKAYENIDWAAEANGPDPVSAWQKRMHFDQLRDLYGQALQKVQQMSQPIQQAEQHFDRERMALENEKLLQRIPEWKDESRRSKEAQSIKDALTKTYGFAEGELGGPVLGDHRVMAILRDAWKYREAIAKRKDPPKGLPQVAKPGAKPIARSAAQQTGDIKRAIKQTNDPAARKALVDQLLERKLGLK